MYSNAAFLPALVRRLYAQPVIPQHLFSLENPCPSPARVAARFWSAVAGGERG
jgi:hypothetical protein